MRALQKQGAHVGVFDIEPPALTQPHDVRIAPELVGLCRTDVYVARGLRPAPHTLTLGHEVAGTILEVGTNATHLHPGQRVAVMPLLSCGACDECKGPMPHRCTQAQMLGVDRDGAFAQELVVPAHTVFPIPDTMSWKQAAYLEPIAASMAPLYAGLRPHERILILGEDRIAHLTEHVLTAHGLEQVIMRPTDAEIEAASFDAAIETRATTATLATLTRALRPGGTLILKSRPAQEVAVDLRAILARELTLRATRYAPFPDAIAALTTGRLDVSELLGTVHPLEDFEQIFALSGTAGTHKRFFAP